LLEKTKLLVEAELRIRALHTSQMKIPDFHNVCIFM